MQRMFKQSLRLTKKSGRVFERVFASVQNEIYINDMTIPVEVGDIFEQSLPSGLRRKMRVTRVTPYNMGTHLDHQEISYRDIDEETQSEDSRRAGVRDVYIQHSTIGAVNLGVISGDLTATITTLKTQGSADLATELERLREAVNRSEELAGRRAELIQALAEIAHEAEQPPEHRKPAVVRVLLDYAEPILVGTAGAADVWHRAYPIITAAFGLPH